MVALLGAVLALAACGQSDSSTSPPAPPPSSNPAGDSADPQTREAFIRDANVVCREATDEVNALEPPTSFSTLAEQVPELEDIARRELDRLLALGQPEAVDERIDPSYFTLLEQQLALLGLFGQAARAGDVVRAREVLARVSPLSDEAAAIAMAYGIVECAGGGEPLQSVEPEPSPSASSGAEEFVAAADAICTEFRAQVAEMKEPRTLEESVAALRETVEIAEAELDRLRALEPPATVSSTFDELLELREQQIAALELLGDALATDDRDASAEALLDSARLDSETNAIEQQLGLEVCGTESVQVIPNQPRPLESASSER